MNDQFIRAAIVACLIGAGSLVGCASNPAIDSFVVEDYGPMSMRTAQKSIHIVEVGIKETTKTIPMNEQLIFGVKVTAYAKNLIPPVPVTFTWTYPRKVSVGGEAPMLNSSTVLWLTRNRPKYHWALVEDGNCEELCGVWTLNITSENGIDETISFEVVPGSGPAPDSVPAVEVEVGQSRP